MLWLESPSNPKLEVYDIAALAEAAQRQGALTVVDNTTAGPLLQRPLDLGADVALTSATKQISGPRGPRARLRDHARPRARAARCATGAATRAPSLARSRPGLPTARSPTLALRLERGCANALRRSRALFAGARRRGGRALPRARVRPRARGGAAPDARLRDGRLLRPRLAERAERFLAAAELIADATSFGGVHTTAERRARWGGDDVPSGFIRLSAGLEDTADLLADVERAHGHRRALLVTGRQRVPRPRAAAPEPPRSPLGDLLSRAAAPGVALDVRDAAAVRAAFERLRPAAVIHTAYRQDDRATTHSTAPSRVARAAHGRARGCSTSRPTSSSTASAQRPYTEDDEPAADQRLRALEARGRARGAGGPPRSPHRADLAALGGRRAGAPGAHRAGRGPRRVGDRLLRGRVALPALVDDLAARAPRAGRARPEPGLLHVAGPDAVNRYELACMIAAAHGLPLNSLRRGRIADAGLERRATLRARLEPRPRSAAHADPGRERAGSGGGGSARP